MKIHVHYRLAYSYQKTVSLSRQEFRILPRQRQHLQIEDFELSCKAAELVFYRRDVFDNELVDIFFAQPIDCVDVVMKFTAITREHNPFDFLLDRRAETTPIHLTAEEKEILRPYIKTDASFLLPDALRLAPGVETITALSDLSRWHLENIRYERRDEGSARNAAETLALKSGACRDTSLLFAEVTRANGFPTRLASGFLATSVDDPNAERSENALHEWAEIYLPGAGWVGYDPTNGVMCDHHYIVTAVGPTTESIAPVNGFYFSKDRTPSKMDATVEISVEG